MAGGRLFVEFEGANSEATVYVNGEKAIYHEGGYSTFRADITDLRKDGENLLVVSVSCRPKNTPVRKNRGAVYIDD